jgi:hypothetical protein
MRMHLQLSLSGGIRAGSVDIVVIGMHPSGNLTPGRHRCAACGGSLGASGEGTCLRCLCAALDDPSVPTLQKIALCSRACALVESGSVRLAGDGDTEQPRVDTLCAQAVRALMSSDDALAASSIELCFGLAGLAEEQLGAGESVRVAMVSRASEELDQLHARAMTGAPPPSCSALLVLIGGMLPPELATELDPVWLRMLAREMADCRLSAVEGAVRARVLLQIAVCGYGEQSLALALGLDLDAHVHSIERTESLPALAIDHMRLLSCLVRHATGADGGAVEEAPFLTAAAAGEGRGADDEARTLRALTALLKRWLLSTSAMRIETCALIRASCDSATANQIARACVSEGVSEFVVEAMRCTEPSVAHAALDALHGLARVALCGERETASAAAHEELEDGRLHDDADEAMAGHATSSSALGGFVSSRVLAGCIPIFTALLLADDEEEYLSASQREQAWELLAISASIPGAEQSDWHGFDELARRLVPFPSVEEMKRLLAVVANVGRSAWRTTVDEQRSAQLDAQLLVDLSAAAIERPPNLPGRAGATGRWHELALDEQLLADVCACIALAITCAAQQFGGAQQQPKGSSNQAHAPPPVAPGAAAELPPRAAGQDQPRLAALSETSDSIAELCYVRIIRPLCPRFCAGGMPHGLMVDYLIAAEALLLTAAERGGAQRNKATERAREMLSALFDDEYDKLAELSVGSMHRHHGSAHVLAPASAAVRSAGLVNLLVGVAMRALGVAGADKCDEPMPHREPAALPLLPSDWLATLAAEGPGAGGGSTAAAYAELGAQGEQQQPREPWDVGSEQRVHTPRSVLQAWLAAPAGPCASWTTLTLAFAVEVMHTHVFSLAAAVDDERSQPYPRATGAFGLGAASGAHATSAAAQFAGERRKLAPRLGELRLALTALLRSQVECLFRLRPSTISHLLRLWIRAHGAHALPLPAQCAPAVEALLSGLDQDHAWHLVHVECIRFGCAQAHGPRRPLSLAAFQHWLLSEAEFLSSAVAAAPATPSTLLQGESQQRCAHRSLNGARTGRDALLQLARVADVQLADLTIDLVARWLQLQLDCSNVGGAGSGDEPMVGGLPSHQPASGDAQLAHAHAAEVDATLDFIHLAFVSQGKPAVRAYAQLNLMGTLGALLEHLALVTSPIHQQGESAARGGCGAAPSPFFGTYARVLELCTAVVSHECEAVVPAGLRTVDFLVETLPSWLRMLTKASHARGILCALSATVVLLESSSRGSGAVAPLARTPIGAEARTPPYSDARCAHARAAASRSGSDGASARQQQAAKPRHADIAAQLTSLPVYLAGCQTVLALQGRTYFERMWCVGSGLLRRRLLLLLAAALNWL